jgi:hypothetical protein
VAAGSRTHSRGLRFGDPSPKVLTFKRVGPAVTDMPSTNLLPPQCLWWNGEGRGARVNRLLITKIEACSPFNHDVLLLMDEQ